MNGGNGRGRRRLRLCRETGRHIANAPNTPRHGRGHGNRRRTGGVRSGPPDHPQHERDEGDATLDEKC